MGFDIQVKFDKSMARIISPETKFAIDDYVPLNDVISLNKKFLDDNKTLASISKGRLGC